LLRLTYPAYTPTLNLLNTHASIISSKYKESGVNFRTSFQKFIDELEASEFVGDYLNDTSKRVTNAHWTFLLATQTDVTDLPGDN